MSEPLATTTGATAYEPDEPTKALAMRLVALPKEKAASVLAQVPEERAAGALSLVTPTTTVEILALMPRELQERLAAAAPGGKGDQWLIDAAYPEGSIGRLMEKPLAVFRPDTTIEEAVERLRVLTRRALIVYGFVTDEEDRLQGVFAFRELLFARPDQTLAEVMVQKPFSLKPTLTVIEAAREVMALHVPAYPVTDEAGKLVGMVRGRTLFEQEAIEISAQAGQQVGVGKEERLATAWPRSFKFRHPWLQLNLLTAFVAGGVVAYFQDTVDRLVILALFLPVLAGQSGNTGCQALAVTLRGMTLGEMEKFSAKRLVLKEAWLGMLNGLFVGLVAAGGMVFVAMKQNNPNALTLALVVLIAMTGSCMASGISGALVPLTLKKFGADPATASSIFLTTATDVASMGLLLGLATMLVP